MDKIRILIVSFPEEELWEARNIKSCSSQKNFHQLTANAITPNVFNDRKS